MSEFITLVGITLAKIGVVLGIVFTFAPILVWAERRQSAMLQDRLGPERAAVTLFGRKWTLIGLLHPIADTLKMFWKEDFVPPKADKLLHAIAPLITVVPAIWVFTVVPFGDVLYWDAIFEVVGNFHEGGACILSETLGADGRRTCGPLIEGAPVWLQIAPLNMGILFVFAVAGTGVVGAAIGGYASDNKFSLLGGLRAAGQMVSYEVALGLTLVGCFMIYDTLRLEEMVRWQAQNVWGVLLQPFALILYLTAAIAETKRVPFDVPEGESEIVAGYFTEYSGMKFGMFFMGEFIEVVFLAALAVTLFFGGWHLPGLHESGFHAFGINLYLPHGLMVLIQIGTFVGKIAILIWFQLMLRWSLPRFRYDQIMSLCWKYLLPGALLNIFATALVLLLLSENS